MDDRKEPRREPLRERWEHRVQLAYALAAASAAAAAMVWWGLWLYRLGGPGRGSVTVDAAIFVAFGLQHSLMARRPVKAWLQARRGELGERSTYVLVSAAFLVAFPLLWQPLGGAVWQTTGAAAISLHALAGAGWLLAAVAVLAIDPLDLVGLRHARAILRGEPYEAPPFQTPGPYRFVRHPIYAGVILGLWAAPVMSFDRLLLAGGVTLYLRIGAAFEERDLIRRFGDAYRRYQATTPMLIPGLRLSTKAGDRMARMLLILALALLVHAANAQKLTEEDRSGILDRITEALDKTAYDPEGKLKRWPEVRERYKGRFAQAGTDGDFYGAVSEALAELKVSHLALLRPDVYTALATQRTVGLGVGLNELAGEFVIEYVLPDSPAEKAGLEPGDTIVGVNGRRPSYSRLRGEAGDTIGIEYRSPDGRIHRRRILLAKHGLGAQDEFRDITTHTAYIRIRSFMMPNYDRDWVREAMTRAMRYDNLILDLRENGGGTITYLADLCGYLLGYDASCGTFITKEGLDKERAEVYRGTDQTLVTLADVAAVNKLAKAEIRTPRPPVGPFRGRLVLLFDGGSASASEVTAGTLVENGRCFATIGRPTMGAVLASSVVSVGKGCGLQYPSTDYLTMSGVRLEGNPLKPQHVISRRDEIIALQEGRMDPAIRLALTLLGDEAVPREAGR